MGADASDNLVAQQGPEPARRKQIGWCEYLVGSGNCGKAAYYTIDLKVDDTEVDVCERHFDSIWNLFDIKCEDDE